MCCNKWVKCMSRHCYLNSSINLNSSTKKDVDFNKETSQIPFTVSLGAIRHGKDFALCSLPLEINQRVSFYPILARPFSEKT